MTLLPPRSLVYIVEDDEPVRKALILLIESYGASTLAHDSAEEFLRFRKRLLPITRPSCMVVDLHLNGLNGAQLLEHMRGDLPRLPVIILTAYASSPLAGQALKLGALNVLEKPVDSAALLSAITDALTGR